MGNTITNIIPNSLMINKTNKNVFTILAKGDNSYGGVTHFTKCLSFTKIWCENYQCFGLNNDNTLYSWGLNNFYQLGNEKREDYLFQNEKQEETLKNYQFKDTFSILVYDKSLYNKVVHYWAINFPLLGQNIKKISCGDGYTFFLSNNGLIYSCGRNDKGQLGFEICQEDCEVISNIRCCRKVTLVEYFIKENIKIKDIFCGSDFSFACNDKEIYYSWGSNNHGQLARKTPYVYDFKPNKAEYINNPKYSKINTIALGWMHGSLLSEKGEVFIWGNPFYDYDKKFHDIIEPFLIETHLTVVDLFCGFHHFCLIVQKEQKYSLMTFGANDFGQLGYETEDNYTTIPANVYFPEKDIEGFGVSEVSCGAFHTICRVKNVLFGFGQNDNKQIGNYSPEYITYPLKWNYELEVDNKDELYLSKIICANGLTVLTYKSSDDQNEEYQKNQQDKEKYHEIEITPKIGNKN